MTRRPETFGAALAAWAIATPDQPATSFEGQSQTFALLDGRANQVARALRASGITPGMQIAYLGKNSDRAVELTCGAARAGVVLVPIIWRLTADEISYVLGDSGAALLFVGDGLEDSATAAMASIAATASRVSI